MSEDKIEMETEAEQADEVFTDELSDEALDREEEGRFITTLPRCSGCGSRQP